jgi:hypothetical protein
VIARDENGSFMGASSPVLKGISDLEFKEAIACRKGLALALEISRLGR